MLKIVFISVFIATCAVSSHAANLPKITGGHSKAKVAHIFLKNNFIKTEKDLFAAIPRADRWSLRKFRTVASTYRHMEKENWRIAKKIYEHIFFDSKVAGDSARSSAAIGLSATVSMVRVTLPAI